MSESNQDLANACDATVCEQFPELTRLNYCYGQMLGAQDFVDEQKYYLNKIALLTRCLHGYGVVCGLTVDVAPDGKTKGAEVNYEGQPIGRYRLSVTCGVAIDPRGRELVVRTPVDRDLRSLMSESDCQKYVEQREGEFKLYLTVQYSAHLDGNQELPRHGCCGDEVRIIKNRWHEEPCVRLTFDRPPTQTCDPCCNPIKPARSDAEFGIENRIWLAELTFKAAPSPIHLATDNTIRRPITTYQPTRVKSVNWIHSGVYEENLAECLLQDGLTMTFTAPIDPQSIKNHDVRLFDRDEENEILTNDIVEVWLCDEHRVGHASMQVLQSQIEIISPTQIKIRVKPTRLTPPQRVLFKFRSDFVLDTCCRPIDGNHLGGFVPFGGWEHGAQTHPQQYNRAIAEHKARFRLPTSCNGWSQHNRPTSGNGTPGGDFQSWFYVVAGGCMSKYDAK